MRQALTNAGVGLPRERAGVPDTDPTPVYYA